MSFGIGQPVRRTEDPRFLTGSGVFVDDITLPGQAHACIVGSPVAHGVIRAIDASADECNFDVALKQADRAMYEVKKARKTKAGQGEARQ